jgi:hypothetical protein
MGTESKGAAVESSGVEALLPLVALFLCSLHRFLKSPPSSGRHLAGRLDRQLRVRLRRPAQAALSGRATGAFR